jgi:NSS family neurotransmitter:Na+ symporter
VLSGWTFDYFVRAANGSFDGITRTESGNMFGLLMINPWRLLFWNTVVHFIIFLVVRRGVQGGIEKSVKLLIPFLFVALIVMLIYGALAGDIGAAMKFMLQPDFSKLTFQTTMVAIGQAFFSIGIAMGALITFGSYLPRSYSIPGSAVTIVLADTGVAMLAGFAIFPLVFAFGMEPSSGPGLIFQTLPIAFGQMPGGQVFGALFFLLLIAAALSSCIGCCEAVVSWVDEHWNMDRGNGAFYTVAVAWLVGILSIMSLGEWSDFYPLEFIPAFEGKTIFDALDFLAANILLLIGATLTAILFGWLAPKALQLEETGLADGVGYTLWLVLVRFVIPPILLVSLLLGIAE